MKDIVLAFIKKGEINQKWLKDIRKELKCKILGIGYSTKKSDLANLCDYSFLNFKKPLGFGKARKLSILLGSELGELCIVTDGDGQFPVSSIKKAANHIRKKNIGFILPKRTNKKLIINKNGKTIDRGPFEKIESLYALKEANVKDSPENIDAQPGLFAFKSSLRNQILPEVGDWLADWEITVKALQSTNYEFLKLPINPEVQKDSEFKWEMQIKKIKELEKITGDNFQEIYQKNKSLFNSSEKQIIEMALKSLGED